MSFRKEKKFITSRFELSNFYEYIKTKGSIQIHPSRQVNSIYFDNDNLQMFHDSEEGILPRKKIRLRWYGDNNTELKKEVKISSFEGRFKSSTNYCFDNDCNFSNINLYDQNYGNIKPKVLVQYQREYLLFEKLRITIDTNINYTDLFSKKITHDQKVIIEVKTKPDISDDYIMNVFGLTDSRFSKYSRAISSLHF
jgi:SPX domain protein involved in polyphosphate accumulation